MRRKETEEMAKAVQAIFKQKESQRNEEQRRACVREEHETLELHGLLYLVRVNNDSVKPPGQCRHERRKRGLAQCVPVRVPWSAVSMDKNSHFHPPSVSKWRNWLRWKLALLPSHTYIYACGVTPTAQAV